MGRIAHCGGYVTAIETGLVNQETEYRDTRNVSKKDGTHEMCRENVPKYVEIWTHE